MRIDTNTGHKSTGGSNTIRVSERAKQQIGVQASEADAFPGSKFLNSAFLDSPRTKKS